MHSGAGRKVSLTRFVRLTHVKPRQLVLAIFLALVFTAIMSGCSPFYVLRAAYEEGKILWRREPIADYIQRPEITLDSKAKLELVLAVREYARDKLKFNVGGSYASYSYVDRPDLTHIVVAAPKTELRPYTWWFLIVGSVPYKGFFDRADAEAEARRILSAIAPPWIFFVSAWARTVRSINGRSRFGKRSVSSVCSSPS